MEVKHIWVNDKTFIPVDNHFRRDLCLKCNCFKYNYFYIKNGQYIISYYIMNHNIQNSQVTCKKNINCLRCSGYNNPKLGYYTKCDGCSVIINGKFTIL